MTTVLRRVFLVATPLALAVALWWHPPGGTNIYADVRDDVDAWLFVHTTFLLFTPLLGIATYLLLRGLESRAAAVSRVALVFFLVFYTASSITPTGCRPPSRPRSPARSRTTTRATSSATRCRSHSSPASSAGSSR